MKLSTKPAIFTFLIAIAVFATALVKEGPTKRKFQIPEGWPKPAYNFRKSPLTEEGINLGRKLFYDPILSRNNTISCASCHLSYTAFTHVDHELSHGIEDRIGTRNSLALMNLAWSTSFMWDGAVNHIEVQAMAPISHPSEMDEKLPHVLTKIRNSDGYSQAFANAFGDTAITGPRLLKALAQFQLTFVTANSKYDQVMQKIPGVAFTDQEARGYELFKSNCNSCHTAPLFTNQGFENNGLPLDTTLSDYGRIKISLRSEDSMKFKVPTLRNIEFSFPYMHDGRFDKLSEVLKHYTTGIVDGPTVANELRGGLSLNSNEQVDILAFLLTLSDKEFLFNPDFAFPRN